MKSTLHVSESQNRTARRVALALGLVGFGYQLEVVNVPLPSLRGHGSSQTVAQEADPVTSVA